MSRLQGMIEDYLAGPELARAACAGMTRGQLTARPVEGKWSTLEVICHLADFESVYAERMKQALALEGPQFADVPHGPLAEHLFYNDRDLEEELAVMAAVRRQMASILRRAGDAALGRGGVHSLRGPMTLEALLAGITKHIPHHLKFVAEKRAALGLSAGPR